jgi:uncharacterized protein (DUF924 family)
MREVKTIIEFWFEQTPPKQWFSKDPAFDAMIERRFGALVDKVLSQAPATDAQDAEVALALILLLDQFTRHIYRGSARAFAGDPQALSLSNQAVARGWVAANQDLNQRRFYLMPMMHSEDLAVQRASLPLFALHTDADTSGYAQRHVDIIEQFGRFPHRNQALGRTSTPAEIEFLTLPGSSF